MGPAHTLSASTIQIRQGWWVQKIKAENPPSGRTILSLTLFALSYHQRAARMYHYRSWKRNVLAMRKLCLLATHHQFQSDSPLDSAFDISLRELVQDHKVDCILEEATSLPPKSCVELLADEFGVT